MHTQPALPGCICRGTASLQQQSDPSTGACDNTITLQDALAAYGSAAHTLSATAQAVCWDIHADAAGSHRHSYYPKMCHIAAMQASVNTQKQRESSGSPVQANNPCSAAQSSEAPPSSTPALNTTPQSRARQHKASPGSHSTLCWGPERWRPGSHRHCPNLKKTPQ